jgi:hypothetical protein
LFSRAEEASLRDRTRARNWSPSKDAFRREHAERRAWGLQRRYAEKLRREYGSAAAGYASFARRAAEAKAGYERRAAAAAAASAPVPLADRAENQVVVPGSPADQAKRRVVPVPLDDQAERPVEPVPLDDQVERAVERVPRTEEVQRPGPLIEPAESPEAPVQQAEGSVPPDGSSMPTAIVRNAGDPPPRHSANSANSVERSDPAPTPRSRPTVRAAGCGIPGRPGRRAFRRNVRKPLRQDPGVPIVKGLSRGPPSG